MTSIASQLVTLYVILYVVKCQDIGNVVIDGFGSIGSILSNTSNYRLSLNDGTTRYLHVSLEIQDPAGHPVPLNESIQVTCEADEIADGFTRVTFSLLHFIIGGLETGQVQISPGNAGRPVNVRCFGQATNSPDCPQTPTSNQTQFCKSTSYSQPIVLQLEPSPIVSFCQSIIEISNTNSGIFTVRLSDPVVGFPVDVSCVQTPPATPGSIDLTVPLVVAVIGSTNIKVGYTVNQRGIAVNVRCSAASQGGGNQYQTGTSDDITSIATFREEIGQLNFIPTYTRTYTTTLEVFLKLDRPVTSSGDLSGVCKTVMTETLAEAKDLYNNPNCIATPTSPGSTNLTSPWILAEDTFQFERGQYYKSVVSRRQYAVISDIVEYVVVTCCARPPSISKYDSMSVAMIAEVNLTPNICGNCSIGVVTGVLTDERIISNPAFVEVAPCSCDKTFKACDIGCCCDADCTEDIKNTFSSCLPGLQGGLPAPVPDRSCNSQNPIKEDWFPLTCVIFEQNSYLGLYYASQPKITTESSFNAHVNSKKDFYRLSKYERRFSDPNTALRGYQYGARIRTNRADVTLSDKGTLSLPQKSANGDCVRLAPVRFLKDFQTDCKSTASQDICIINSEFSARVYAESSTIFKPPCPEGFHICEEYGRDVRAPSYVNYYCADNDYMQNYLQSSLIFEDLIKPNISWIFNSTLSNEDCENPCQNPNCTDYNSGRHDSGVPLPARCSWDDGYTRAPIPRVLGGNCLNAVVDVRYKFTWLGQKVIKLEADIIMGPLPVSTTPDISQSFKVAFHQDTSELKNSTDNFNNLKEKYDRSGSPGYDMGKVIFSGCSNMTGDVTTVDMDISRQMAVWQPGVDGLCYNAKRRSLMFGEDVTASCLLRLGLSEINDCENLKTIVLNHLNTLMPSTVLGRQGYNDPNNQTYWVEILRQNLTELLNNTIVPKNVTDIFGNSTDGNVTSPIDFLKGICRDITSGIHLDILYGETGKGNGYPINEILGGRISYSIDDWQLSCSGSNSVRCRENSTYVETFLITSSVRFLKVPAQTPVKPILFWAIHTDPSCQSDSCQRYFENFDKTTCYYDTCWHELFYPISASYTADPPMYVLAFTLVTVIFVIGYYMIGQKHKLAYGISKDNSIGNIINTFPTECCT